MYSRNLASHFSRICSRTPAFYQQPRQRSTNRVLKLGDRHLLPGPTFPRRRRPRLRMFGDTSADLFAVANLLVFF